MVRCARRIGSALTLSALCCLLFSGVPAAAQEAPGEGRRIDLNLENADIRYALRLLFNAAGVDYTIDQAVQGVVTVSLRQQPFLTALEAILRSTATMLPLTYRVEGGVYTIAPKIETPEEMMPEGDREQAQPPPLRWDRLRTRHLDAATMAEMLELAGVGNIVMLSSFPMGQQMGFGGFGGFGGGGMGGGRMGGGMGGFGGGMGGFGGGMGGFGGGMGGGMGGFGGGM
ncbi:MAG TPA: hypothetical protein VLH79_09720, partial [Chthonomonadales bacterium]|nr:hypothetical protein [Chthonomonadales bacterium]